MQPDFKPDPSLFPFASRWFDGAGPRVHYVDEGRGPAVVMFHGNPTWTFLYRKVIVTLRDRFRCVAVDYPGFGLSERPAGYGYTAAEHAAVVGKLVDHLGLDDFIVVGQDWGGPIGMTVAVERAERVSGMVIANTWFWPAQGSFTVFSLVMSTPPLQWLILKRNFFVKVIMPRLVERKLEPAVFETYQKVQPSPESRRGVAEKPMELVWAMKDPAFGRETVIQRWLRDFPDGHVTRLGDANHYVQEDAPEALAAAVERAAVGGESASRVSGAGHPQPSS